jgi:hypothetical protein
LQNGQGNGAHYQQHFLDAQDIDTEMEAEKESVIQKGRVSCTTR